MVTSEIDKSPTDIYKAYHGLWRIEESFRILKTYLESRPVFLQLKESIYGHFLICYFALTILRLIEIKVFNDEIPPSKLIEFIRGFNVTQTPENSTDGYPALTADGIHSQPAYAFWTGRRDT